MADVQVAADGLAGRVVDGEHVIAMRVYFADTDAGGVMYHASYLALAERARTEMLRLLGFDHDRLMRDDGLVFAVRHCEIDFLKPARLDDLLTLRSHVVEVGGTSLRMSQSVGRGAAELARLLVRLVCIRLDDGRPVRLPAPIRAAFGASLQTPTPQAT